MKTPSVKKVNSFFKVLKVLLAASFILAVAACEPPTGPDPTPGPTPGPDNPLTDEERLVGTWAYDYGYDQNLFCKEEITLNADKSFIINMKRPSFNMWEIDKGTYRFVNDSIHGQTIEFNLTSFQNENNPDWENCNVTISFKYYFDNDDTVHIDCFKKDFSKQGGRVLNFEPLKENTYYRIKDGTKEILTSGKWRVNKSGTPDCDWDEEWTFNADGTMKDEWTETGSSTETYDGTYEIIKMNGKNVLHHTLDWKTSTPEWWYEYKSYGPNLISVQLIKSTLAGEVNDAAVNYYYREVETETFTYHFANYTYTDKVPKADTYKLINHVWQIDEFSNLYAGYEINFLGWYDNQECTGNEVTTSNGSKKEFWAKTSVSIKAEEERDNGAYYYGNDVFAVKAFSDVQKIDAKKGDTINVYFEATVDKDFDGRLGLDLTDYYGQYFWANCWHTVKSNNKKIKDVFTFQVDKDVHFESIDDAWFIIATNYPTKEEFTFTDLKFVFLDDTNSCNITYKFGDVSLDSKSYNGGVFYLPETASYFEYWNWDIAHSIELLGWYENADFSGTSVTKIPAGNTADKTFYAKFNPKIRISSWKENDGSENHNYNTTIPVKALLPGVDFNPKAGDTIAVYFEANISHDLNGWGGLRLVDETNGWNLLAQDWNNMKTEGNKLSKVFNIKIDSTTKLPSIDNLSFDFGYDKAACDEIITFTDLKFIFLDETNSYNVIYKCGDVSFESKGYKNEDYYLPETARSFEMFNWNLSQQELLGFYDNPEFTGNPITSIPAGNTADKTFYVRYNLVTTKKEWDDANEPGGKNHLWDVELPIKAVIPDFDMSKYQPGATIKFKVTAKLSDTSSNGYYIRLIQENPWTDLARNDYEVAQGEINNGILTKTFEVRIWDDVPTPAVDNLLIGFGYSKETYDKSITLSDWKFVLIDESDLYTINYHIGEMTVMRKAMSDSKINLITNMNDFNEEYQYVAESLAFSGWYENQNYSGSEIKEIPASTVAPGNVKDVYMKVIPVMTEDLVSFIPLQAVLPESQLNSLKFGSKIKITAKTNQNYCAGKRLGLNILDQSDMQNWTEVAHADADCTEIEENTVSATETFEQVENRLIPSDPKKILLFFSYDSEFINGKAEFTDFKIELVE